MLQEQLERLIQSAERGDVASREELFTVLYRELHRLAQRDLRRNAFLTMSPTTLLHETYLNLSGRPGSVSPTAHASWRMPRGRCAACSSTMSAAVGR